MEPLSYQAPSNYQQYGQFDQPQVVYVPANYQQQSPLNYYPVTNQPQTVYYIPQDQYQQYQLYPNVTPLNPVYTPPGSQKPEIPKERRVEVITNDEIKNYVEEAIDDHETAHILGVFGGTLIAVATAVTFLVLGPVIPALIPLFLTLGIVVSPLLGFGSGSVISSLYEMASDIDEIDCEQIPELRKKEFQTFVQSSEERTELIRQGQFNLLANTFFAEQELKQQTKTNQKEIDKIQQETNAKIDQLVKEGIQQIENRKRKHETVKKLQEKTLQNYNEQITRTVKGN